MVCVFVIAVGAGLLTFSSKLEPPFNLADPTTLAHHSSMSYEDRGQHLTASIAGGIGMGFMVLGLLGLVTPWVNKLGIALYPNIEIDDRAEVVEYRIGTDRKYFAQLTFYQARYRLPDGTIHVCPANGPKSLIRVDTPLAFGFTLLAGAISILCFWLASTEPEPVRD